MRVSAYKYVRKWVFNGWEIGGKRALKTNNGRAAPMDQRFSGDIPSIEMEV